MTVDGAPAHNEPFESDEAHLQHHRDVEDGLNIIDPDAAYTPDEEGDWDPVPTTIGEATDQLAASRITDAYDPDEPTDWDPAPTTIAGALDQLAARLTIAEGA